MNHTQPTQLNTILNSLLTQLNELHQALLNESEILTQKKHDELDQYAAKKEQCTKKIEQLEIQRSQLLEQNNFQRDEYGLIAYLENFNSTLQKKTLSIWNEIKEIGRQCHSQNQINGIVVLNMKRKTEFTLGILRGQQVSQDMYSASGEKEHTAASQPLGQV